MFTSALIFSSIFMVPNSVSALEPTCNEFHNIYKDGKDLCEKIFSDSFVYEKDETKAYSMWWFDAGNPNDATTALLHGTGALPTECQLQYFHKTIPSATGISNMTECHPYAKSNCCYRKTVKNARTMNEGYGEGFQWDRCGRMSSQCSRFFVQEACLYECDISAGLYRKCSDAQVAAAGSDSTDVCYKNTWQMYKMPIKASYCDAWYASCYRDKFCASTNGDFFECAKLLSPQLQPTITADAAPSKLPGWAIALIVVLGAFFILMAAGCAAMVHKEKQGNPLFKPLSDVDMDLSRSFGNMKNDTTSSNALNGRL